MPDGIENRTIAFGGLMQCVHLTSAIAWDGQCAEPAFDTCINSVLRVDAANYADVYGGIAGISLGLKRLGALLVDKSVRTERRAIEEIRYSLTLLELHKRLANNREMQSRIGKELADLNEQAEHLERQVIAERLGALYRATISTLNPRVIVHGEPDILNDDRKAVRIRALLFAGIRAAMLWRQAGGNRIKMLWERHAMMEACTHLLAKA